MPSLVILWKVPAWIASNELPPLTRFGAQALLQKAPDVHSVASLVISATSIISRPQTKQNKHKQTQTQTKQTQTKQTKQTQNKQNTLYNNHKQSPF